MKFKPSYLIIPLVTILVAALGGLFTQSGMEWYKTELIKPALTPPDWAFSVAWTAIFIATAASAIIVWNKSKRDQRFWVIISLFFLNAFLNVYWCFLFFFLQTICCVFLEIIFLELTTVALFILIWKISRLASFLLIPYILWVGFATYLTYVIADLM